MSPHSESRSLTPEHRRRPRTRGATRRRPLPAWAVGVAAAVLVAGAATGAFMPAVALAASGATATPVPPTGIPTPVPTKAPAATRTPTTSGTPAPGQHADQAELATSLMQDDSRVDRLSGQLAQNQQQQAVLQAQVGGDQARIQQLNQQINSVTVQAAGLTALERQERAQQSSLAHGIFVNPSSLLLSLLETGSLGSYLTRNSSFDTAVNRAQVMERRIDSLRRKAQASRVSLVKKRGRLTADERQKQASQTQLQGQATQLQSRQSQLEAQWTQAMLTVARQQPDATLTALQTAQMATLGTGGLDQQTLDAGLAAGMYTLSTSTIRWPAQPDTTPLGLAAYPSYCQYTPIQCTCYAANAYQRYTGGVLPKYLGNAGQWIGSAQADGIPTSPTPAEGSVVVFNGPDYSVYGHASLVRSVIFAGGTAIGLVVWERNLDEMGGFDVRVVALGAGSEIAGFIPPPS